MVKLKKTWLFIVYGFLFFLIYQTIKRILGGSWSLEQLILSLVILNISFSIFVMTDLAGFKARTLADTQHIQRQLSAMGRDLRRLIEK